MPSVPALIIDTDFFADVDDVGALAVAHRHARRGLCTIAAITLNTPSRFGVPGVRSLNRFYGASVPVGAFRHRDDSVASPGYAHVLADEREPAAPAETELESVALLKEVLLDSASRSITVVSIGFLDNLAALATQVPDLVGDRVARTVVMAGRFPEGREFNIERSVEAARTFIQRWPVPITFVGWEVGASVITGRALDPVAQPGNPVARAYVAYCGSGVGRMSWDLEAVDLAVRGLGSRYALSEPGEVRVDSTGWNTWTPDPAGRHRYAVLRAPAEVVAEELDAMLEDSFELARK